MNAGTPTVSSILLIGPRSYGSNSHFGDKFQTVKSTVVATSKSKFTFFTIAKLHIFVPCYMTKSYTFFEVAHSCFAIITHSMSLKGLADTL